jgi:branched-subunit amino acid transport protein
MTPYLVVLAVGAGTYLFRVSLVGLVGRRGSSARFERAARFVVPSAFAALAAGSVAAAARAATSPAGTVAPVAAVAVAAAAARRTGSPRVALAVGMPTLWVLNALLGG